MDSLEKVRQLIDSYLDAPDDVLEEMVAPMPIQVVRGVLPILPMMLPDTSEQLDEQINGLATFVAGLVSDPD